MYGHLLVPLDGSDLAETALPAAAYFARILGADTTLLHVIERNPPEAIHGQRHLTRPEEARSYLENATHRAFPAEARVKMRVESDTTGNVARSIQEFATNSGADLVIMCTHGRSGLRHLLSGSNAQQVISCGCIPVMQIRPPESGASPPFACRRILVPLDGRIEHEQGLEAATGIAALCKAELRLLMIVPTMENLSGERAATARLMPGATSVLLDLSMNAAEEYLQSKVETLRHAGASASIEIQRGEPADAIIQEARRTESDLIVLGTHRRTGTSAFWSGSIAPRVTSRSNVPVLLLPLR